MGALRGTDGDRAVKRRRLHGAVAAGVVLSLTLSACGGSDADGGGSGGSDTLTVASGAAVPLFGPTYLAESLGYFEEEEVDVDIMDNTGANTGNFIASGEADIAVWTLAVPVTLAIQGKQTSIVMAGS